MHSHLRAAISTICGILALASTPGVSQAQHLSSRDQLLMVLGSTARTETFDEMTTKGNIVAFSNPRLDATTVIPGVGAGAIEEGISFTAPNNGHWFFPPSYAWYGNATGLYAGGGRELNIWFGSPTTAFGLDLWVFWHSSIATTISVYGLDGQLVSASTLKPTQGQFFGWQNDGGISRVTLTGGTNDALTVRIDDLTFGAGEMTTTPEPATLTLVGAGLVLVAMSRRRRQLAG